MNIEPFKLERYFTSYEHSAQYSLCDSDCESMTIKDLLSFEKESEETFLNTHLGYTETKGSPRLREDISAIYNNLQPENITVCSGAQEPIFLVSHALLKPGDEVIVQSPGYQSLRSVPESIGCKVLSWDVEFKGPNPVFNIDNLKKLATSKTKAIYLNAPHNPTGYLFTREEQQQIIALARQYEIIVLCDEVYRELEHSPEYRIPAIADVYELGISISVMSKSYGLPGLRIGWLATQNQAVLDAFGILKEYTTICNAAPSEFLAGVALRNRHSILNRNLEIVENNLVFLEHFFERHSDLFSWYKPNAGSISFVKMLFDEDDMTFAQMALNKQGVLLLPGGLYDYSGYFRIGFGRKSLPAALAQFEEFVDHTLKSGHKR